MEISTFLSSSESTSVWLVIKIAIIIGLLFYLIFATVVIRQVKLMTKTLEVGFEGVIILTAWLHLIFAIGTLLAAIFVL